MLDARHQRHVRGRQSFQIHVKITRVGLDRIREVRHVGLTLSHGGGKVHCGLQVGFLPYCYPKQEGPKTRVE